MKTSELLTSRHLKYNLKSSATLEKWTVLICSPLQSRFPLARIPEPDSQISKSGEEALALSRKKPAAGHSGQTEGRATPVCFYFSLALVAESVSELTDRRLQALNRL